MRSKKTCVLLSVILSNFSIACSQEYLDVSRSFEQRASDLVSRMTLEEKISQLNYQAPAIDRLGIPAHNYWNECLHGVARSGLATVFPQAIGMAAMWDKSMMAEIAEAISDEARAKHHEYASRGKRGIYQGLTFWTPNINIFRDPRWGRGMETYGEDPFLTAELAIPFIKGLQGSDPKYLKVIATAKHFVVHSGPEASRHRFDVRPSMYDFLETYSPHFERVVKEAEVYSVMCAYNRLNGEPCCGNKFLSDLLRKDWGFKGYIVSDCWAIKDFYNKGAHEVVSSVEEASAMAVKAGTDLNCGDSYPALLSAVEKGLITEQEIDVSVRRIMEARMRLGLFAPPGDVTYETIPYDVVNSAEHAQLALQAARKSIVLLKNKGKTLPFSKKVKKVAVIGPTADDLEVLLGNYNGYPVKPVTPLSGIKSKLPDAEIIYEPGCRIADGLPIFETVPSSVLFTDSSMTQNGLKASYFANSGFEGDPKHERVDTSIDFIWRNEAPFEDMEYEHYSIHWEGVICVPESGRYALGCEGFSGIDLFLEGKHLAGRYDVHCPRKEYKYVDLEAGKPYKIELKYRQNDTEYAMARFLWEAPDPNMSDRAVEAAKQADVVIMCMGLSPLLEGEEMNVAVEGFSQGDKLDIKLPAVQTELMQRIAGLGKPSVMVLLNGSAIACNWEQQNIPAIVEAWYPGQEGGHAIADVIFGDYNPSGRLPITFYKDIDDIPLFDDYSMQGKTYRYFRGTPLYEFGYGLSYTDFRYSDLNIAESVPTDGSLKLRVTVSNKGERDGDEIVQVYLSHSEGVKAPIRSLVAFERVFVKSGESVEVEIPIPNRAFVTIDSDNKRVVLPGRVHISVGGSQPTETVTTSGKCLKKSVELIGKPRYL